jgi:hypothetical protein
MGRHSRRTLLSQEAYRKGVEAKAAANQPSNTNNPPPSVQQPTELLTNQNLSISAASAAALPRPQQINSTSTNDAMDTSQIDINDVNNQLFNQQ